MTCITVPRERLNFESLEATLIAALDDHYNGISTAPGEVRVHLVGDTPPNIVDRARRIVVEHDPYQLTAAQTAAARRQTRLHHARTACAAPLDLTDYDYADSIIRNLAKKIYWLEQEIRDLRGLPPTEREAYADYTANDTDEEY